MSNTEAPIKEEKEITIDRISYYSNTEHSKGIMGEPKTFHQFIIRDTTGVIYQYTKEQSREVDAPTQLMMILAPGDKITIKTVQKYSYLLQQDQPIFIVNLKASDAN